MSQLFKASAIVSTYSSEKFIAGCLEDLTQQTLFKKGALEILVIDSSSPQNEFAIVREFQARFPNINYHRTAARETLYGAWNTGVRLAQGEYLTNSNTDDRHHPEAIEKQCIVLDHDQKIDLVYADCLRTNVANEQFLAHQGSVRYRYKEFFAPDVALHYQFGPQPLWRRQIHQRPGYFDPNYRAAGDWEFNFRFNLAGCRAKHIPEILGLFLDHPNSISLSDSTSGKEQAQVKGRYLSMENLLKMYEIEGWTVNSAFTQAEALNHFALRAADFTLPWEPGKGYCDISLAVPLLAKALELLPNRPELISNLGAILARSGRTQEALKVYESTPSLPGTSYTSENISIIQSGRIDQLKIHSELTK